MKFLISSFCLILLSGVNGFNSYSQISGWELAGGKHYNPTGPAFQAIGIPDPSAHPGPKINASTWVDSSGNMWLFGGQNGDDVFSDMWKYDPMSKLWTWLGNYSTNSNSPNGREGSTTWIDVNNDLWLYGGYRPNRTYSDYWKYTIATNSWTLMYGNPGGTSTSNGSPNYAPRASWVGGDGKFYACTGSIRYVDTSSFNWQTVRSFGFSSYHGVKGAPTQTTQPGNRGLYGSWNDSLGNFWIYGGGSGSNKFNDLWKFNFSDSLWTWVSGDSVYNQPAVYGLQGVPSSSNNPGARSGFAAWNDSIDNLYLFGGEGYDANGDLGKLSDLWKYDPIAGLWTWVAGDTIIDQIGTYTYPDSASIPRAKSSITSWKTTDGKFWMYGGIKNGYFQEIHLYDLDYFDVNTNSLNWADGNKGADNWEWGFYGIFGEKGVPSKEALPGSRRGAASWIDNFGNLWLFGGFGFYQHDFWKRRVNDLWKYNYGDSTWTYISGDTTTLAGNYGTKGVASPSNFPGGRDGAVTWSDNNNMLWLFSGMGYDASGTEGRLNDLWRYDIASGLWTWISGDTVINSQGTYGTVGVASINNVPSARTDASAWTDSLGISWLYGGSSVQGVTTGFKSDTWRFNPYTNEWTFMLGTSALNSFFAKPWARSKAASCVGSDGNLWLFGGQGSGSQYGSNELWKYDPVLNKWYDYTWYKYDPAYHGTRMIEDSLNVPVGRMDAGMWSDSSGNIWMFGGDQTVYTDGALNDIWRFDTTATLWTWMGGDDIINQASIIKDYTGPNLNNKIGGRSAFNYWKKDGNINIYGGNGYAINIPTPPSSTIPRMILNDQWALEIGTIMNVELGNDVQVCPGDTVVIGVANNVQYAYSWNTGDSTSYITIVADSISSYTLYVTDLANQVTGADQIKILAFDVSAMGAPGDTALCNTDSVQLLATGGLSYNWQPSAGLSCDTCQSPYTMADTSVTYQVSITDSNLCTVIDSVNLVVNPSYYIIDPPKETCSGSTINIYGVFWGTAGIYYDSLSTGNCDSVHSTVLTVNPSYDLIDADINICLGDSILIYGTYQMIAGMYYDSYSTVKGCDSVISINLIVTPITPVGFTGLDTAYCLTDPEVTLTGSPSGGTFNGNSISANTFNPAIAGIGSHAITYIYTDGMGCSNSEMQNVNIKACTGIENIEFITNLQIFPNPTTGLVILKISLTNEMDLDLQVFNSIGQVVITDHFSNMANIFETELDLRDFSVGVYKLLVFTNSSVLTRQIIVE